jgi:hypothetical protein
MPLGKCRDYGDARYAGVEIDTADLERDLGVRHSSFSQGHSLPPPSHSRNARRRPWTGALILWWHPCLCLQARRGRGQLAAAVCRGRRL